MKKILFISVKPEFVNKIFNGSKTIELRKSSPHVEEDDIVLIYTTSPVMAVTGMCKIKKIIKATPSGIWKEYESKIGIDKKRFFQYYEGKENAIGIELKEKKLFKKPITLKELRKNIKDFNPPQTYRYIEEKVFTRLQ